MREVHYDRANGWTGHLVCVRCHSKTKAWRSSGMSDSCPHFYCTNCSNVILRRKDQDRLRRQGPSEQLLQDIQSDLPYCPCGGRFAPSAGPKCPACGAENPINFAPVQRLTDSNMIVVSGSCIFGDADAEAYRVVVDD